MPTARLKIVRKDPRCAVVNLDPRDRQVDILKAVVRMLRNFLGVYASVERPGRIAIGDAVWLA